MEALWHQLSVPVHSGAGAQLEADSFGDTCAPPTVPSWKSAHALLSKFGPLNGLFRGLEPASPKGLLAYVHVMSAEAGGPDVSSNPTASQLPGEAGGNALANHECAPIAQLDVWRRTDDDRTFGMQLHVFFHPVSGMPLKLMAICVRGLSSKPTADGDAEDASTGSSGGSHRTADYGGDGSRSGSSRDVPLAFSRHSDAPPPPAGATLNILVYDVRCSRGDLRQFLHGPDPCAPWDKPDQQQQWEMPCPQLLLFTHLADETIRSVSGVSTAPLAAGAVGNGHSTRGLRTPLQQQFGDWLRNAIMHTAEKHKADLTQAGVALPSACQLTFDRPSDFARIQGRSPPPAVFALERLPPLTIPSQALQLAGKPGYSYLRHIFPLVGLWQAAYGGHGTECIHVSIEPVVRGRAQRAAAIISGSQKATEASRPPSSNAKNLQTSSTSNSNGEATPPSWSSSESWKRFVVECEEAGAAPSSSSSCGPMLMAPSTFIASDFAVRPQQINDALELRFSSTYASNKPSRHNVSLVRNPRSAGGHADLATGIERPAAEPSPQASAAGGADVGAGSGPGRSLAGSDRLSSASDAVRRSSSASTDSTASNSSTAAHRTPLLSPHNRDEDADDLNAAGRGAASTSAPFELSPASHGSIAGDGRREVFDTTAPSAGRGAMSAGSALIVNEPLLIPRDEIDPNAALLSASDDDVRSGIGMDDLPNPRDAGSVNNGDGSAAVIPCYGDFGDGDTVDMGSDHHEVFRLVPSQLQIRRSRDPGAQPRRGNRTTMSVGSDLHYSTFWGPRARMSLPKDQQRFTGVRLVGRKVIGDANVPTGQLTFVINLEPHGHRTAEQAIPAVPVVSFAPGGRPQARNLHNERILSCHEGKGQINMYPSEWNPRFMDGCLFVFPPADAASSGDGHDAHSSAAGSGSASGASGDAETSSSSAEPRKRTGLPNLSFLWYDTDDFHHIIDYRRVWQGPDAATSTPAAGAGGAAGVQARPVLSRSPQGRVAAVVPMHLLGPPA